MNILKNFKQDTVIYIDGANLFYSQKSLGVKIDYQKLYNYLTKYKRITEVRIYLAFISKTKGEDLFIQELQQIGYKVIAKKLKFIKEKSNKVIKKGNLDIELALDAYRHYKQYRTFVLFSGDSDFSYLVKLLKKSQKRCLIFSTKNHVSTELLNSCHRYYDLKNILHLIKKDPSSEGSIHSDQKT